MEGELGRVPGTVSNAVGPVKDGDRYLRPPPMDVHMQKELQAHIAKLLRENGIPDIDDGIRYVVWVGYDIMAISINDEFDPINKICVWDILYDDVINVPALSNITHQIEWADPECFDKMVAIARTKYNDYCAKKGSWIPRKC